MDNLMRMLERIGLTKDEVLIYLFLLRNSRSTVIDISKGTKILRTKVYRLIEGLKAKGLVIEIAKESGIGRYFQTSELHNIDELIEREEIKLKNIREEFKGTYVELEKIQSKGFVKPRVVRYKGVDGLMQIMWNSSKAKGTLRIYEIQSLDTFLDYGFYEEIRIEHVNSGIRYLNLTNSTDIRAYTNVVRFVEECLQTRHIPEDRLKLDFEFIIYNDVYAMYSVDSDGELVGIEIYDQKLVDMQSEIFDYIWSKSNEMEQIGSFGSAKLIIDKYGK